MASIKITSAKSGTVGLEKYLKQEEKTESLLMYGKDCDIDNFAKDFKGTKELYGKTEGRQHYHIIQSFNPGEVSPEQAHEVGEKLAESKEFQDFQVAVITHKDKEHIHNHIIVNAVSLETGKKYISDNKSLYNIRDLSDNLCKERGLSIIEKKEKEKGKIISYDMNKYQIIKNHLEGKAKSYVVETVLAVEKSLEKSTSKENFIELMKEQGYSTSWIEARKNITFENSEGQKVRLSNLEKTFNDSKYSKEGLINEFKRVEKERTTRNNGNDFEYIQNDRGTEYVDNKSLLRAYGGYEQGEQQTTGNTGKEHPSNNRLETEQLGSERPDNREEQRQFKIDEEGKLNEQRGNNLNEQNESGTINLDIKSGNLNEQNKSRKSDSNIKSDDSKEQSIYRADEQLSNRDTKEQPTNEADGRTNETRSINIEKANDSKSFDEFNFNYFPNDYADIKIKEKYFEKLEEQEKGFDNMSIPNETVERARKINLKEYLEKQGYTLEKDNIKNGYMNYKVKEISGLSVSENGKWYDFTKSKGGKAIDFVMQYENKNFKEAVEILTEEKVIAKQELKAPPEPLILPQRALDNKQAINYLTKTRGLKEEIIKPLIEKGLIYQTERGNVVFVGKNSDNEVKYCFGRGVSSDFKGEAKGSKKEYSFSIEGKTDKLYIYESPIDLLSHSTLRDNIKEHHKLSLGGLSDKALNQYLKDHEGISTIVLCLDNDEAGLKTKNELVEKLLDRGFKVFESLPTSKDWNEDLINKQKEIELKAIEQNEIEKQEKIKIAETLIIIEKSKPLKTIFELKNSKTNEKIYLVERYEDGKKAIRAGEKANLSNFSFLNTSKYDSIDIGLLLLKNKGFEVIEKYINYELNDEEIKILEKNKDENVVLDKENKTVTKKNTFTLEDLKELANRIEKQKEIELTRKNKEKTLSRGR